MKNNQTNIMIFQSKVNRPLILDGAIGSLLQQRDVEIHKTLWSSYANIVAKEKVIEVHKEYVNAGADIITTNTFRTNPLAYNKAFLKISNSDFVKVSVKLAKEAVGESESVFIAGSNSPAEDSYQVFRKVSKREIELNHKNHIDMLWNSGVDFILNETQSHFDEIKIICKYCSDNRLPYMISLFVTHEGRILSGEPIKEVLKYIADFNPIAIGINCVTTEVFNENVREIDIPMNWGFYLNCGSGAYSDAEIFEGVSPSNYINTIKTKFKREPFFIGSCCGSSPEHTKAIKEYVIGKN